MARSNPALLAWNRGLVSPLSLGRVDLDRLALSAEVYSNWLPKTQGPMRIRPGTKHFGESHNDTGAFWVEFVAATDDVALLELTNDTGTGEGIMRAWLGSDAHNLSLLERPAVDTTVSLTDTGWEDGSTGGAIATDAVDVIPDMTGPTTDGVTVSASSELSETPAWQAADDDNSTVWQDTGSSAGTLPSWWNADFGTDTGDYKGVTSYSIRSDPQSSKRKTAPKAWRLITGDHDTGTFATDTGKWTLVDERSGEIDWAVNEKRTFTRADVDTGTIEVQRHWRLYVVETDTGAGGPGPLSIAELELFDAAAAQQVKLQGGTRVLNATSIGALAKTTKRVIISDTGTEHSLAIHVSRGPVVLRVGSTDGDDDYISEASLGTGYHNLAFTPQGDFHITLQSDAQVNRIVQSLSIGDSGTVEVRTPWTAGNLDDIRYDQSADVVYVDCASVMPQKIERRGTGRSWSVVEFDPDDGPFLPLASSSAKFSVSHFYGNTTLNSDIPFFTSDHVGALMRVFHEGQGGEWALGALDAKTDAVKVTGIGDTGEETSTNERQLTIDVSGTFAGETTIERSFDGLDIGFQPITDNIATASDTGSRSVTVNDTEDNIEVFYRVRVSDWTSGAAIVTITYGGGGQTGIARITGFNSNTDVDVEVLRRFSDTGESANWQQGYWSDARGFPSAVALHGGRLAHAVGGNLFLSVSDDFESFDEDVEGDAGPIIRTLGSGPVDNIFYLVSLLRLIIGTAGAEISLRSSSLDEPVTPDNSSARAFSTQGSANVRAVRMDDKAIFVQRSKQRVFMSGFGIRNATAIGDYAIQELTLLVPDLLKAGVVEIAIQRQPDTRIHCVTADGDVFILTYEPDEEVICWTKWETDGTVERAMVLPGVAEDAVYYHVRRVIGSGNDSFTKVLLHFDGPDGSTSFADSNVGGSDHTWTASGDAQIDTAESKFGGASGLFDGTGDFISTPDHADFSLGSSDFTIDLWAKINETSGSFAAIANQSNSGVDASDTSFIIRRTSGDVIQCRLSDGSSFTDISGTTQFTDSLNNEFHHIAFVRSGNTLMLFIDGTQEASTTFSGTVNNSSEPIVIGAHSSSGITPIDASFDEFRLSVGVARWTEDFTAPTQAYGSVKRFLEKWALERESVGDTGLHWLADCAVSFSDTGRANSFDGVATHLVGESVVAWGDLDTGSTPYVDLSPDVDGVQTTYTIDTGGDLDISSLGLNDGVNQGVLGLPYTANWKSTKMAYSAQGGTALAQMKRIAQIAFVLRQVHNNALFFGSDTGNLDPLPRVLEGATVDPDKIFTSFDEVAVSMDSTHNPDARVYLRAKAPRPVTVLAAIPSVGTHERV